MDKNPISLKVKCPHCNQSLMDFTKLINDNPSIKLNVKSGDNKGKLYLCSIYGYYDKQSVINLVKGEITELLCPNCNNNLKIKTICNICGAPVIDLNLETGGKVHICSRVDCKKHNVLFEDIYDTLTKYFIEYDYKSK